MQVIPVIDLKNGIVVHARQGNRESYAPLVTKLCESSDIFDVILAFRQRFGFGRMYIADLNALLGDGNNAALLSKALQSFPDIEFWVDAGYPLPTDDLLTLLNYRPILGSESFTEATVSQIKIFNGNYILSLDHNLAGEMGAPSLFRSSELWPDSIIIMSLPHVGSHSGPDLIKLKHYIKTHPGRKFIAAGGVRHKADLDTLKKIGVTQCLIASALHNGDINPADLAEFEAKKYPG